MRGARTGILSQVNISPADQPGLAFWFDAAQILGKGIALPADNTGLDIWRDLSGRGLDVAPITATKALFRAGAFNNRPSVQFANSPMNNAFAATIRVRQLYAVFNYTKVGSTANTFADYDGLLTSRINSGPNLLTIGNIGTRTFYGSGLCSDTAPQSGQASTFYNFAGSGGTGFTTMSALNVINSTAGADIVLPAGTGIQIGQDRANTARRWQGHIIEIFGFETARTAAQNFQLERYIKLKHGIAL